MHKINIVGIELGFIKQDLTVINLDWALKIPPYLFAIAGIKNLCPSLWSF